jgi:uncharacterized damage-inducible protein DinB
LNARDIQTLIRYHGWATEKTLRKARKIPAELVRAEAPLSHGSILATFIHMVDTQWYWRSGCMEGWLPVRTLTVEDFPDVGTLLAFSREDRAKLEAYVSSLEDAEIDQRIENS